MDKMSLSRGITVSSSPPYYCELNPIELIWAQVKGHVARENSSLTIADVQRYL